MKGKFCKWLLSLDLNYTGLTCRFFQSEIWPNLEDKSAKIQYNNERGKCFANLREKGEEMSLLGFSGLPSKSGSLDTKIRITSKCVRA